MNISIRLIKENEIKEVAEVFKKVYNDFDVGENWDSKSATNLLKCLFDRQPDLFFIAEVEGKIVGGFVANIKPWWDGNHLVETELFVDTKYQKEGIGTKLSRKMYEEAIKKYNISTVEGATFKNKKFPLAWHKSKGFEENKEWVLISGDPKLLLKNLE